MTWRKKIGGKGSSSGILNLNVFVLIDFNAKISKTHYYEFKIMLNRVRLKIQFGVARLDLPYVKQIF